jgi:hypothetical protein
MDCGLERHGTCFLCRTVSLVMFHITGKRSSFAFLFRFPSKKKKGVIDTARRNCYLLYFHLLLLLALHTMNETCAVYILGELWNPRSENRIKRGCCCCCNDFPFMCGSPKCYVWNLTALLALSTLHTPKQCNWNFTGEPNFAISEGHNVTLNCSSFHDFTRQLKL